MESEANVKILGCCRTTDLNLAKGADDKPKACESLGYFFHTCSLTSSSSVGAGQEGEGTAGQKLYLTGLMGWHSVEAKQEWYTDFAEGIGIYERLGHKIDALRMVCHDVGGVESRVFHVNGDDLIRGRTRRGMRGRGMRGRIGMTAKERVREAGFGRVR